MSEPDSDPRSRVPFAWLPDWLLRHWWRPFAWLLDWWSRRWRRIALVLLVLVAVLLVVRAALDLWAGRRLSAEISRLEKVYGRLDPATLAPPRVPPAENRARVMRAAASLTNVNTWAALGRSYAPTVPATPRPEDRQIVEENRLAVQVAEQGRRRPKSNWEIDYANDEANFPRLLDVRTLGRVLAASCRVDVDAGRPDQAAEAALAGLAEAASLGGEPPAIIQLIRIAIAREQMACVQGLLERDQPAAAALTELAMALVENRTPDPIHIAFIGELKHANYVFGQMERGDVGRDVRRYIVNPSPVWAGPVRWLCRPLIRYGRLRYLRRMARMLELQSVPPFARSPSDLTAWPQTRYPKWWQVVQRFDATFIGGGLTLMAEDGYCYMSQLNGAELAVALRRFRLDRGRYPDALAELAPQYLAQVPIDPFTGRPPEYTRQGEGFELRGHGPPRWVPVEDSRLLEWKVSR